MTSSAPSLLESTEVVPGLGAFLAERRLEQYAEAAEAWCRDMGAVDLAEVEANEDDFADALQLKPLERKRLAR